MFVYVYKCLNLYMHKLITDRNNLLPSSLGSYHIMGSHPRPNPPTQIVKNPFPVPIQPTHCKFPTFQILQSILAFLHCFT